jgi:DNA-binding CsgD family transcriptional regulator
VATPIGSNAHLALGRLRAYASWIRYRDILMLQGPPLLGAVFALRAVTAERLGALLVLAVANLLLVAHIFVFNDWAGVDADLNDANKRAGAFATRGLSRAGIRRLWIALLAVSLGLFGFLGLRTMLLAAAIVVLSALYSGPGSPAKGVPILGSALHLGGGMLHVLLGVSLFGAIDGAAMGLVVLDPTVVESLGRRETRLSALTKRQIEVLSLMAKGNNNAAIAKSLVLEEKSVENHINAIFGQLNLNRDNAAHPRVKAVLLYLQETLGSAGEDAEISRDSRRAA